MNAIPKPRTTRVIGPEAEDCVFERTAAEKMTPDQVVELLREALFSRRVEAEAQHKGDPAAVAEALAIQYTSEILAEGNTAIELKWRAYAAQRASMHVLDAEGMRPVRTAVEESTSRVISFNATLEALMRVLFEELICPREQHDDQDAAEGGSPWETEAGEAA